MKKFIFVLSFVLGLVVVFSTSVYAKKSESLYNICSKKESVKIYVAMPVDASGEAVDVKLLKTKLESALKKRVSLSFDVVKKPKSADLIVQCEITEYFWSNEDPLDMLMGAGGAAYDAAILENYSRMQANFSVLEKSATVPCWAGKLKASVTDAEMKEKDGFLRASEKMAKVFMKEAFGKKKVKQRGRR